jgi:hypothetical protein
MRLTDVDERGGGFMLRTAYRRGTCALGLLALGFTAWSASG